jgi:hypothetical protein
MHDTREDVTVTQNEPPPEAQEPIPTPQEEVAVLDVIEGEVIELVPPEETTDHLLLKQQPYWLLIPLTIVLCLVFGAASFLFPLLIPSATITIVPVTRTITLTTAIQVHARQVPALTLMQTVVVPATGIQHQSAREARGSITWYNGQFRRLTIPAGTIVTGTNGVRVITDQAATLPAGSPPTYGHVTVPAHALVPGTRGNIQAYDINQACCLPSVFAKNTTAFTGGMDARDIRIVTGADIAQAVSILKTTLNRSLQAALQAQLHPGEALMPTPATLTTVSNHQAGDEAEQVQVTVSATCIAIAHASSDVDADATQVLTPVVRHTLGAAYALLGDIHITIVHATITDHTQGIAMLALKIDATYLYQIRPPEKAHLSTLLAGKPKQQAITILLQVPGIQAASIHLAGGNTTLPTDPHYIQIIVMYRGS